EGVSGNDSATLIGYTLRSLSSCQLHALPPAFYIFLVDTGKGVVCLVMVAQEQTLAFDGFFTDIFVNKKVGFRPLIPAVLNGCLVMEAFATGFEPMVGIEVMLHL